MNQNKWVILKLDEKNNWQPIGPMTQKEVRDKLQKGIIKSTDFCWLSGWKEWKKIHEESEFFLTQKAPIEIPAFVQDGIQEIKSDETAFNAFVTAEVPLKTSPLQYFGWKFKKKKVVDPFLNIENEEDQRTSKMPEPWEAEIKKLNFVDTISFDSDSELLGLELKSDKEFKPKFLNWFSISVLIITGLFLLTYFSYELINKFTVDEKINLNLSYFVIEDFTMDLPKYMYARSDLKKGQSIKVRLFDAKGLQVKTQTNKAGINLVSQGTGRIRIPLYPFKLENGVYTLKVEIEGQTLEKEFQVSI